MFFLYVMPADGPASFVREYDSLDDAIRAAQEVAFTGKGTAWVTRWQGNVTKADVVYQSPAPLSR